jgi:hypothetical protein
MESLGDDQELQQGAAAEYAATATSPADGTASGVHVARSTLPAARREEVQRLLTSVLVVRCDASAQYAAPVVIMSQEESNIYTVIERHLKREYLLGAEKFWRLVRSELGVDYWRPRVYGSQLKVLQGARLPEYEEEFQAIQQVVDGLDDCLRPGSSPEALVQDLRSTIAGIQQWWGERNKKPDGEQEQHCCSSSMLSVKEHSVWICKTGHHHRSHYSTAPEYRAAQQSMTMHSTANNITGGTIAQAAWRSVEASLQQHHPCAVRASMPPCIP